MKTIFRIGFLMIILSLLVQPVSAQRLLKSLKEKTQERIEEKIEERANKKVDEKIDEGLDKIEESLEKEKKEESSEDNPGTDRSTREAQMQKRMSGILKGIGVSGESVPFEDFYKFDHLIQMHIESFDGSGKKTSDGEFITHLNPSSKSMAYQVVSGNMGNPGQGMFIIDAENGATIILSEEKGKKTGIVYGMGSFFQSIGETYSEEALEDSPEMYLANPNVKKTGKTKTIAGHKCEEYVYTDEDTESEIWITKDLKMNTQDFFSTLFKTSLYSHGIGWGYMMESTSKNKTTGEKSMMRVTKVDTNSNVSFNMGDYQVTNLGSFTIPVE